MKPTPAPTEELSPARRILAAAIARAEALAVEGQRFDKIHDELSKPLNEARTAKAELERIRDERKSALLSWSAKILDGTANENSAPPLPPTGAGASDIHLERLLELSARVEACESALATLNERRSAHGQAQVAAAEAINAAQLAVMSEEEAVAAVAELDAALAVSARAAARVSALHMNLADTIEALGGAPDPRARVYIVARNRIPPVHACAALLPFDQDALYSARRQWVRLYQRLGADPTARLDEADEPTPANAPQSHAVQ